VTRIPEIDRAMTGKGHAVTAVARRQNTVEHINAACYGLKEIVRRPDTHKISRPICRKHRRRFRNDAQHDLLRLSHGKAADGVALEIHIGQRAGTVGTQCRVIAALDNAEQCVPFACHTFEGALAALGPPQ
jgi:hypothetical protein